MKKLVVAVFVILTMLGQASVLEAKQTNQNIENQVVVTEVNHFVHKLAKSTLKVSVDGVSIQLSWSKSSGATGYKIYYSTKKNGKYKLLTTVKGTSYTFNNGKNGTKYYFKVRAYQKKGKKITYSSYSNIVTARFTMGKPAISSLRVLSGKSVEISWSAMEGADRYVIYRSTKKNSGYKAIGKTENTTYVDSTAKPSTTYYYKIAYQVVTSSKTHTSSLSTYKSVKTKLSQPSIQKIDVTDANALSITFSAVKDANGYYIYRSTSADKGFEKIASVKTTEFTDTNVKYGVTYYYQIVAYMTSGKTTYSSSKSTVASGIVKMTQPKITSIKANDPITIELKWNSDKAAEKFELYKATSANGKYTLIYEGKAVGYKDSDTKVGQLYYYKLVSVNGNNQLTSNTVTCKTVLACPVVSEVEMMDEDIQSFTFTEVSNASSYVIFRGTSSSKLTEYATVTDTAFIDYKATAGTKYYYAVCAKYTNKEGLSVLSDKSNIVSGATYSGAPEITVSSTYANLMPGKTFRIKASCLTTIRFTSTNTSVCTVASDGTITGVNPGSATVIISNGHADTTRSIKVTVYDALTLGIDVSYFQGGLSVADFRKLKEAGIDFVYIRACYSSPDVVSSSVNIDPKFETYYKNCKAAGMNVGFYQYVRATTEEEAIAEANWMISLLDGKSSEYPVMIDIESSSSQNNKTVMNEVVPAWCKTMEEAGYDVIVYSYATMLNKLSAENAARYDMWPAQYNTSPASFKYPYTMWQFSSSGYYPGLNGRVDVDLCWKDYPTIIKEKHRNGY